MHAALYFLLLIAGTIFSTWYISTVFYDHFGGLWTYLGTAIGFVIPITIAISYDRYCINKFNKKFEHYRSSNGLQYDILEHNHISGFAVDLKNNLFILHPANKAFRQISFDVFQSVKVIDGEMIFQVKDIESPLIPVEVPKPKLAMARLKAAEIIS